jgi:alginate O-acetyltransferase complex protein AlgI
MLFTSPKFFFFLIPVLLLYWLPLGSKYRNAWQNGILLISGIVFYSLAQGYYLFLMAALGLFTFYGVLFMHQRVLKQGGNGIKLIGILVLVAVLCLFKYETYCRALLMHWSPQWRLDAWVLPLGISFFTFQLIGYWIDVYQENINPCKKPLAFMAYLFFFPKLMSGPIERVQHAMPYFEAPRVFDALLAEEGLRQFIWGLFKKRVVADTLALYVFGVFQAQPLAPGGDIVLACFLFPLQLYADFSGYSDMALGIAKLFGIRLTINFKYPFFAQNISDYWQRWHISLTSWMMDYVYTPMSFYLRRWGKAGLIISIISTFTLVGIWHGADWKYVVFGIIHGIYFIPMVLMNASDFYKQWPGWLKSILIYSIVSITSILLLSENVVEAWKAFMQLFTDFSFTYPVFDITQPFFLLALCMLLLLDYMGRKAEFPIVQAVFPNVYFRNTIVLVLLLAVFYVQNEQFDFLYLKF